MQHQVGTGQRNVACNLAEIGEAMGDEAFASRNITTVPWHNVPSRRGLEATPRGGELTAAAAAVLER